MENKMKGKMETEVEYLKQKKETEGNAILFKGAPYTLKNISEVLQRQLPLTVPLIVDSYVMKTDPEATWMIKSEVLAKQSPLKITPDRLASILDGPWKAKAPSKCEETQKDFRTLSLVAADLLAVKLHAEIYPNDNMISPGNLGILEAMILEISELDTLQQCLESELILSGTRDLEKNTMKKQFAEFGMVKKTYAATHEGYMERKAEVHGDPTPFEGEPAVYTRTNLLARLKQELPLTSRIVLDSYVINEDADASPNTRKQVLSRPETSEKLALKPEELTTLLSAALDNNRRRPHTREVSVAAADLLASYLHSDLHPSEKLIDDRTWEILKKMVLEMSGDEDLVGCLSSDEQLSGYFKAWKEEDGNAKEALRQAMRQALVDRLSDGSKALGRGVLLLVILYLFYYY